MYHALFGRWVAGMHSQSQRDILREAVRARPGRADARGMVGEGKPNTASFESSGDIDAEVDRLDSLFRQFQQRSEVEIAARGIQLGGGAHVDDRPGDGTAAPSLQAPSMPSLPTAAAAEPVMDGAGMPETGRGSKRPLAPHQIKGSKEAKEHMARLRAKRVKK